jgi:subtilisin family serine protease
VIKNINTWYDNHPKNYSFSINKSDASATVTRYHPKWKDEKNTLIRISNKEMNVTIAFTKSLDVISTHKDSLQKYFRYVSIDNIYNEIPATGWNIHPQTPLSSLRGKGVEFTAGGDSISLMINWSIYTVMGYKDTEKCHKEMAMMDMEIKDSCYVAVDKNVALEIIINDVPIDSF